MILGFTLLSMYVIVLIMGLVFDSSVIIWVFIEISLYLLIMFMLLNNLDITSLVLYYVTQTLGSCIILWGWLVYPVFGWVGLFLNLGVFPFSVWVFNFMSNVVNNSVIIVVLGLQNLLPMCFMVKFMYVSSLLVVLSIISCFFGVLIMLQSNSFHLLIPGSSVLHTSWVILYFWLEPDLVFVYYWLYILLLVIVVLFNSYNYGLVLTCLSSVPPLFGFYLNWVIFCDSGIIWLILLSLLVLCSGLSTLGYFRWLLVYLIESSVSCVVKCASLFNIY